MYGVMINRQRGGASITVQGLFTGSVNKYAGNHHCYLSSCLISVKFWFLLLPTLQGCMHPVGRLRDRSLSQLNDSLTLTIHLYYVCCHLRRYFCLLPARRRPQGLVIIGVCLSVRTVFVRKISQERVHGSPPNLVGGSRG